VSGQQLRRQYAARPRNALDDTPVATVRPIPRGAIAGADDLVRFPAEEPRADARRHRWRILRRSILAVFLLIVGYYAVTLAQVYSVGRGDQARPVDAIVVLGAAQYDGRPSPQLAARLDHVVTLYGEGLAPLVVVTGGKQPDDRFTEAESSAQYLADRGVPPDAIMMERSGHSTYQSMAGVAEVLAGGGLDRVVVVTDPYHALRARLIAQDVGLTAYASPTPTSVVHGGSSLRRHLLEAGGVALGRIIGFDRL
jgi:uncharacterized SAM-binding protein YcdF (DUF218 family)